MNCVSSLLCLLIYTIECRSSNDLFLLGSTVDLASVLRHNLLTNNDDFTQTTRPIINYRRSQYLPSVDMLDIIKKITGETAKPLDGIIYPKHDDFTTTENDGKIQTIKFIATSSKTKSLKSTFSGYYPKINLIKGAWRRNMINREPLRQSNFLQPNKLVVYRDIFEYTTKNPTKIVTSKKTTKDSISIFYESVTTPLKTSPQKAVVTKKTISSSGLPSQWIDKLREDAWKRKVGPVKKITTHNNLVIDEHNFLQHYQPFTGENFEQMKEFMATKFFEFESKPGNHVGKLVPIKITTTKPASISIERSREDEPNPHLLDMVHAKGDKFEAARRRRRICDRNVLFPEGPKYDQNGRIVVAAHSQDTDYARTKIPKYIVPRCCNCCKKSVIGCE